MQEIEFIVENAGERLDKIIVGRLDMLSRAQIQALIRDGLVTVDGAQVKAGVKLRGGERVRVTIPPEEEPVIEPEDIPLNVIYEDKHLAVIDKPAGLVTHPGVGNESGTLLNAVLAAYPEVAEMDDDPEERRGIVHRLDKETSGLIVIARDSQALHNLMQQFQDRTVDKTYLALLERTPETRTGRIDAPIGRDPDKRKLMAVRRDGKPAVTDFEVMDDMLLEDRALVRAKPQTGRTHQIRVHFAFINCPIVGDAVYGYRKQRIKLKRHFLHAAELCFDHPATGERVCFESPLPTGLANILDKMRVSR